MELLQKKRQLELLQENRKLHQEMVGELPHLRAKGAGRGSRQARLEAEEELAFHEKYLKDWGQEIAKWTREIREDEEAEKEAAIAKQLRKAREERK